MDLLQSTSYTSAAITVRKKRKFTKNVFVTKCKFGFPRPVSENTVLQNVEQSMKSEKRIYHKFKMLQDAGNSPVCLFQKKICARNLMMKC